MEIDPLRMNYTPESFCFLEILADCYVFYESQSNLTYSNYYSSGD